LERDVRLLLCCRRLLSWLDRRVVVVKVRRWLNSSASVSSIGADFVSLISFEIVSLGHEREVGSTVSLTLDWVSKPSSSVSESDNNSKGIVGKLRFSSFEVSTGDNELDDCWLSSSTGFGNEGNWNQSIFRKNISDKRKKYYLINNYLIK
jgi:hypothetical protein